VTAIEYDGYPEEIPRVIEEAYEQMGAGFALDQNFQVHKHNKKFEKSRCVINPFNGKTTKDDLCFWRCLALFENDGKVANINKVSCDNSCQKKLALHDDEGHEIIDDPYKFTGFVCCSLYYTQAQMDKVKDFPLLPVRIPIGKSTASRLFTMQMLYSMI